jgi:hypothetical protein
VMGNAPARWRAISDADAYAVACPRCHAGPQAPCTYTLTSRENYRARYGRPTARPHDERRAVVRARPRSTTGGGRDASQ